jgi:hypothetical protein
MAMRGKYRRNTTSLYFLESREAERKLAEARKKKKAQAEKSLRLLNPKIAAVPQQI